MSSKDIILQKIRAHTVEHHERPQLDAFHSEAQRFDDPVAKFIEMTQAAGGRAVVRAPGESLDAIVRREFPDARRIAGLVDAVGDERLTVATFHPDDVADQRDLNGTDLALVRGELGVCENGCVWITQSVRNRAIYFIAEALVLFLDRNRLVHTMHEAYARPEVHTGPYGYGFFNSGPSKTADIENALVFGAHGPREVCVVLV